MPQPKESESRPGPVAPVAEGSRVRYAPSPTGLPHVGNIRTALFNWLYARHTGGKFIVRIEDTDVARTVPGALEAILDSLRWLGLDWDEGPERGGPFGPYVQSQRLALYRDAAERLVSEDKAYLCFCTPQRLDEMRAEQARQKQPPKYDQYCLAAGPEKQKELLGAGTKYVMRFKTPGNGQTVFTDLIRGEVAFENATLDDFVLLKSDGYPTYHLASIVDDHAMRITHVMRAEEWLSSAPRHVLLYRALGWEQPQLAHLPMILGPDRSKLSKRHGATSLIEYRDLGFLPETMFNFLALLGWSLDDRTEIFTREDLVRAFSIERISKTAAIFDKEKLEWMNGMYLRRLSPAEFAERALPFLEKGLPSSAPRPLDRSYLVQLAPLVQERARTLVEAVSLADFFFVEDLAYDPALLQVKGTAAGDGAKALRASLEGIRSMEQFDAATLEAVLRPLAEVLCVKTGVLFGLLRVACTGRTAAPPLFQTMAVLGKERCVRRIENAAMALERAGV